MPLYSSKLYSDYAGGLLARIRICDNICHDEARRNLRPIKPRLPSVTADEQIERLEEDCSRAWMDSHKRMQRPPDDGEEGSGAPPRRTDADRLIRSGSIELGIALVRVG